MYWKEDGLFYRAACAGYDAATGAHSLLYEDGEREALHLRSEAVKWLQPPQVRVLLTHLQTLSHTLGRGQPCQSSSCRQTRWHRCTLLKASFCISKGCSR